MLSHTQGLARWPCSSLAPATLLASVTFLYRLLPRSRCGPGCSLLRHLQPHPRPPVWIVADETTRVVSYLGCALHTATLLSGLQGGTSLCHHVAARAFILQGSQVLGLLGPVPSQPQSGGPSAVGIGSAELHRELGWAQDPALT